MLESLGAGRGESRVLCSLQRIGRDSGQREKVWDKLKDCGARYLLRAREGCRERTSSPVLQAPITGALTSDARD